MTPWLTIIIPVYKVEKYIQKCLDSITVDNRAFLSGVEVVVVDDGSPDRSGRMAAACALRHPFVHVIHQPNAGVAAARNTGMDAAHGSWIYFMDSDDWMAQGAIGKMRERCGMHRDADILLFDAWQDRAGRETAWEHFDRERAWTSEAATAGLQRGVLYPLMAHSDTRRPLAAPWDKVYRRDFVVGNGLRFAGELAVLDDMVFNMEAFGAARKIVYCKEKIYHYRHVPDSITNTYRPDRVQQDRAVWAYIERYMASREGTWEKEQFRQAFYCRVIKSFGICCRLCFFHAENDSPLAAQIARVKQVMASEPCRTAFRAVRLKNAEWRLKALILVCRCGWGHGVWLLHLAQNGRWRG